MLVENINISLYYSSKTPDIPNVSITVKWGNISRFETYFGCHMKGSQYSLKFLDAK